MRNKVPGPGGWKLKESLRSLYLLASTFSHGSASVPWNYGHMCKASLVKTTASVHTGHFSLSTYLTPLLNRLQPSFTLTATKTVLPMKLMNFLIVLNNLLMGRPTGLISASVAWDPLTLQFSSVVHLLFTCWTWLFPRVTFPLLS